ncbi:zinc ribbon domain-containing protein [Nocardia blacklockiae]|uniref:zinc ribbon domain-containing protein n=1 Tax=Nocardia blacklockiae TaxID=480036 RepID=UPI00189600CB|nr:zinc ribbon domain-containing protein [Nocardia blacklockiae]MBF6169958.1 zinc ribbon domain-containing protein [Nocardia blacklockiae]
MPTCWHCGDELTGARQRHCTACGASLCWQCGHAVDDPDRRYCTDCGAALPRGAPAPVGPRPRRTARLSAGFLIPVILVLAALGAVTAVFLLRDDPPPKPAVVAELPARTTVWNPPPSSTRPSLTTATPTPTLPALTGPAAVVWNYFDAANRRDYLAAWNLGGHNLDTSFDHFAAGFATTARDQVTIVSVTGNQVEVTLDATQSDGGHRLYTGYYIVDNGEIVRARMREQ